MEEILREAAKNPWVFAGLAVLAAVSAWQPLARIVVAILRIGVTIYRVGLIESIRKYKFSVEDMSNKIVNYGDLRNSFLISYTTISIIIGVQTIISLLFGMSILLYVGYCHNLDKSYLLIFGYIFIGLGAVTGLIWLIDAHFQILVHRRVRELLGKESEK